MAGLFMQESLRGICIVGDYYTILFKKHYKGFFKPGNQPDDD